MTKWQNQIRNRNKVHFTATLFSNSWEKQLWRNLICEKNPWIMGISEEELSHINTINLDNSKILV